MLDLSLNQMRLQLFRQSSTAIRLTFALSLRRGSITESLALGLPNGYIFLRKDRAGTRNGGGVAVICRSDWQIKRLFSSDSFECVWSVITTPNSKYYVAAVYHPPDPVYAVYAVYPVYQH